MVTVECPRRSCTISGGTIPSVKIDRRVVIPREKFLALFADVPGRRAAARMRVRAKSSVTVCALFAREEAVETWLRTEVVASYDELRADPSRAISAADMRAHLAQLHAQRLAARDS
ncbi:hypothetical protein [Microbacterium sp.]|uniref:hypothetical protein n=1 Tax=Microbacterium sp. TaxID=51671 RepID=UPI0039E40E13